MKRLAGATAFILLGCVLGGLVATGYLSTLRNEDSHYGVRLSQKCLPEDGALLKLEYAGNGTAFITVLPPEPEASAPAQKEKKK